MKKYLLIGLATLIVSPALGAEWSIRPGADVSNPCDAIAGTLRIDGDSLSARLTHPQDGPFSFGGTLEGGKYSGVDQGAYVLVKLSIQMNGDQPTGRIDVSSGEADCDGSLLFN